MASPLKIILFDGSFKTTPFINWLQVTIIFILDGK